MNAKIMMVLLAFIAIACSSASKVSQKDKEVEIHYSYGTQELMGKNYTQAITHLLKAVELDPKNAEAHNNLGMAYYFKGEKDMSLQHIRRALKLQPKNTDALLNLASLNFERGDFNEAEKLYLRALKDLTYEKHARTYFNLALIELRRKNIPQSIAHLDSSLKEDETYCPSWFQKGMLDYKARRFKLAQKNFRNAQLGVCVNDPAPLYWQAVTEIDLGNYLNARLKLDELMTRFGGTNFAPLAQQKLSEVNFLENNPDSRNKNTSSQPVSTPSF